MSSGRGVWRFPSTAACLVAGLLLCGPLGCGEDDGNSLPIAVDDMVGTSEDTPVSIPVLANDFDPDGNPINVSDLVQPVNGTAVIEVDGTVTYTPPDDFFGVVSFDYDVADGVGGSATATVQVSVTSVNDPPEFTAGSNVTVDEDCGPQTTTAWATVAPAPWGESGQTLQFNVTGNTEPGLFAAAPALDPATGDLTFTPAPDTFGSADVTITLSDNAGGDDTSAPVTFTISVTSVNDPPVAVDDAVNLVVDTVQSFAVMSNDFHPDGKALALVAVTQPSHGVTSIVGSSVEYDPAPGFTGIDEFTYTIEDPDSAQDTARVVVGVSDALNGLPVAVDDAASTDTDTVVPQLDVLANDSDPDLDTLALIGFTQPPAGVVTLNDDGTLAYTPPHDGAELIDGADSFTYVVGDGQGGVAMASVTISVSIPVGTLEERKPDLIAKCHAQMLQIGVALQRYRADHDQGGEPYFPAALSDLVGEGYLPNAKLLVCPLDYSNGTEGGRPPDCMNQFPETDDPGVSYFYEMSLEECSWDWMNYLDPPSPLYTHPSQLPDRDGDPAVGAWQEVKLWQLWYGDFYLHTVLPDEGYPPELFPIVRCFWHAETPDSFDEVSISNLSFDWTIFLSTAFWEEDVVEALTP